MSYRSSPSFAIGGVSWLDHRGEPSSLDTPVPEGGWRCFHCSERFTSFRAAWRHFGSPGSPGEKSRPRCVKAVDDDVRSGGLSDRRALLAADPFETAVDRALGDLIRSDDAMADDMWAALANIVWRHVDGHHAWYSFRAAGDLIAAIRGEGNYLDWYCNCRPGAVTNDIAGALAREGWCWEAARG